MLQAYFVFSLSSPAILHRSPAYLLEIGIYSIGFTHYKSFWEIYINILNMRYIRHIYQHGYILTCRPAHPVFVLYLRLCTFCIHETLMSQPPPPTQRHGVGSGLPLCLSPLTLSAREPSLSLLQCTSGLDPAQYAYTLVPAMLQHSSVKNKSNYQSTAFVQHTLLLFVQFTVFSPTAAS